MDSKDKTSQDYSDLPTYQTGNSSTPLHVLDNTDNGYQTFVNSVGMSSNFNINTTPSLQNDTFEFYFPLPNDTRIYYVTYTELHPLENAQLLNNSINLSHIPEYQFPHHYNIQSLIRQQIQQVQQHIYQQNNVQQQFFNTAIQPTPQVAYSADNNNVYNMAPNPVNGTISDNIQDAGFQNSS
ncbi:hypothetical protein RclHR1_01080011 [Rhizophagus clarus]|uniref:Uncharacterized protein n=1 Tax=Rhizophagus clarus TaxID=94130 RepID=A0A2Z6Q424_9GLOM|nr:hypothetical protein RclHR1_01080011 [Rhizophagus clarus]GES90987.1 hypothetical protein GLOIN_2v1826533 [Rhizophagus clarus]